MAQMVLPGEIGAVLDVGNDHERAHRQLQRFVLVPFRPLVLDEIRRFEHLAHVVKVGPHTDEQAAGEALRLAGVGTDAVARATGKAWDQWLAILDKAGAVAMPHKATAAMLADKYGLPPWWSQMVTVGYEQARGLREAHQKGDGFAASASRTLQASLDRAYGAWKHPSLRALWLGAAPVEA